MPDNPAQPRNNLHGPEERLETAQRLTDLPDPEMKRAALLEAITAARSRLTPRMPSCPPSRTSSA